MHPVHLSRPTITRQHWRWAALLGATLLASAAFEWAAIPAGRLLGAMVAAILVAVLGGEVRIPASGYIAAQGVIGCLIARGVPGSIGGTIASHWPSLVAGVLAVTVLANALGWLLSRWKVFPGDTAIWGAAPGAASAMMVMAEAYGADVRLVAFMQYVRIVCVSVTASIVAHLWVKLPAGSGIVHAAVAHSMTAADWQWSALTLLLALGGAAVGTRLRLPAGALLVPMIGGILLQDAGGMTIELPSPVLTVAYAFVGWSIGMRFNRQVLVTTLRSLPKVLASTMTLIALCGVLAAAMVRWAHVDPLTAYLATSPGGADSIAIIAAASPVDIPFVLTMQVLRMLFVMFTGPAIARGMARHLHRRRSPR